MPWYNDLDPLFREDSPSADIDSFVARDITPGHEAAVFHIVGHGPRAKYLLVTDRGRHQVEILARDLEKLKTSHPALYADGAASKWRRRKLGRLLGVEDSI